MAIDRAKTLRGALAGAAGAAAWAAQQPLDKRVFGVDYDDVELLGKFVTRGPGWRPIGFAMHVANGAVFGAVYSAVAPSVQLPSWARGPLAAMAEHAATWPSLALLPVIHPAADDFPPLVTNPRAFAQATWRHLLFGVVMGELERRLNAPEPPDPPSFEEVAATNGHGDLEAALSGVGRS